MFHIVIDNDIISNFDDETCKNIQLLLWEQATKCHDAGWLLFKQFLRSMLVIKGIAGL